MKVYKPIHLESIGEIALDNKNTYFCNICKSNHYFDSDVGKEHLHNQLQNKIIKLEEYKKEKVEKDKELIKNKQNIKVNKIIIKKEYHAKCEICGRQLKKALETNIGVIGFDCYLQSIGIPTLSKQVDIKDLPPETFEGVAENLIKEIEKLDKDIFLKEFYGDKYDIIESSKRISPLIISVKEKARKDWKDIDLLRRGDITLARLLNIPTLVIDKAFASKTFNDYYLKKGIIAYNFVEDYPLPKSLSETLEDIANTFDTINDFTEDIRGLKKGTPSAMISGAKRTTVGKSIRSQLGEEAFEVGPVQSITVPFSLTNTETGAEIQGEILENLEKYTKQLTPVSSTNVKAGGQFNNELLVQFHPKGLTPQRTYRYKFQSPEVAEEAWKSLLKSGSPGRWVWKNLRGHQAGEKVTSSKLGPAYFHPEIKTIGGTTASLVPYTVSNRVPVTRVKKFDEIVRQMKRTTPNPTQNPDIGSRVEKWLQAREGMREMKIKGFRTGGGVLGLPRIDFHEFNVLQLNDFNDLTEDLKRKYFCTFCQSYHWFNSTVGRQHLYKIRNPPKPKYYTPEELNAILYKGYFSDEPYQKSELSLKVDKNIDLTRDPWEIRVIDETIRSFPFRLKAMVNEVRVYNQITDDPNMKDDNGKVPEAYKKVGWTRKYNDIEGVYLIGNNNIILNRKAMPSTTRHELGHSVWYGLTLHDQEIFKSIHKKYKKIMLHDADIWEKEADDKKGSFEYEYKKNMAEGLRYEANDVQELFAESFKRYYEVKKPLYIWESWKENKKQYQYFPEISKFFRERMKKYEKNN